MHQGDAGSDAYDRDFALSVLAKEQDALYEIEQALRRIKSGTYGNCEISEKKIPTARLEAIPFARLTVECQAQWEKEYGNRRYRPSNEVGFSGGNYVEDEDSETVLVKRGKYFMTGYLKNRLFQKLTLDERIIQRHKNGKYNVCRKITTKSRKWRNWNCKHGEQSDSFQR
jgi:RNA polymerase-binding transcription factor DksA